MKSQINHNAGGDSTVFDEDVMGIRPIIVNTFGKCDLCFNYEANKTACLAGAVSPLICGTLYNPIAPLEVKDDENTVEKIGENPSVIKAQCLHILNGSAPEESKIRAMAHLFKSVSIKDQRVWAEIGRAHV